MFLFSLVGGVIADRMDRRTLLLAGQTIQMSCAFLLAGLFAFGVVEVWHILWPVIYSRPGASFRRPSLFRPAPIAG